MYIQVHEPIHKKTQVTSQFIKSPGKSLNKGEKGIYLKRKKNPPNIKQTYKHTKNSYKHTKKSPHCPGNEWSIPYIWEHKDSWDFTHEDYSMTLYFSWETNWSPTESLYLKCATLQAPKKGQQKSTKIARFGAEE